MLGGKRVHDAAHAWPEAHVQHAVRLVEDEHLDLLQAHVVVLHEVDQATRGGNEQVAPTLELLDLAVEFGAAHYDDRALTGLLAHHGDDLLYLRRELARGRDHERVRALALGAGHELQRGQREGRGLARARLRGCHDVATREDHGDGLLLNGGRGGEAEGVHPGENLLVKPELGKCSSHACKYSACASALRLPVRRTVSQRLGTFL